MRTTRRTRSALGSVAEGRSLLLPHALRHESGAVMINRRGKGEGSISQRPDGLWVARINIGTDATGKRKRKAVYGHTKKEVADKLTRLAHQKLDGTLVDSGRLTVSVFLERWLSDSSALTVRASTQASYQRIVRLHIVPKLGGVKLTKLCTAHVQNLMAEMIRAGKSPRLTQMAYAVLHRALTIACKWKLVSVNAADAADCPAVPKHEITPLNAEQSQRFLEAAEADRLASLYVLALTTGCRQGELFGLEWADVDLKAATLTVRRTLVELSGKLTTNEPKTSKGRRLIELPRLAVESLWSHKARLMAEGLAGCSLVFPDSEGNYLRRQNVLRRSLQPIVERAGLGHVRFHDLRHSSATLLLSAGVHPKVVQERLGHSKIGITMDVYSHVLPSMQVEASGKLDGLLRKAIG